MSKHILLLFAVFSGNVLFSQEINRIDYDGFLRASLELRDYRQERLIDFETFQTYAQDEKTIILDCRSKSAYDEVHLKGAIHFNFSDFTAEKLAEIIPSKDTRILIYCNNNFQSPIVALADKNLTLALNIPTFINLHGYGYENIYELKGYLKEEEYCDYFEYAR